MQRPPHILVFQHIDVEHPGIFRDFMAETGVTWQAVELDEGEAIPDLGRFDALWVMGGPMDVWQEDAHPWLAAEKAAIREAVAGRGMPYLGLCLGHQLLADALGGRVGPAAQPEIGIMEIVLTEAGRESAFLSGIPPVSRCLQWHSAEVVQAPEGAAILASSAACRVQTMAVGETAFSVQYHVELTATTVDDWAAEPAYQESLERTIGSDALPGFKAEAAANMAAFNRDARRLYDNFMAQMTAGRAIAV